MGQMTYALCYGVPMCESEGCDDEDLLEEYEKVKKREIKALAKKMGVSYSDAVDRIVPDCEVEGTEFVGFFVAAGASGMVGLPHLEGFRLTNWSARYKKEVDAAMVAWSMFSEWCNGQGIKAPEGQLWLIECEVA